MVSGFKFPLFCFHRYILGHCEIYLNELMISKKLICWQSDSILLDCHKQNTDNLTTPRENLRRSIIKIILFPEPECMEIVTQKNCTVPPKITIDSPFNSVNVASLKPAFSLRIPLRVIPWDFLEFFHNS